MSSTTAATDIWTRVAYLTSARQFDAVETVLALEIHSALKAGETQRAATDRIAFGFHLQKCGKLKQAQAQLQAASSVAKDARIRFDADFYLAKVASQRGSYDSALRGYADLEARLRSGEAGLDGSAALARLETLLWRQGYCELMTGNSRAAESIFSLHREMAVPTTNQFAINWVYGRILPALLRSDASEVGDLDEAMDATSVYGTINVTARFTHPHLALVQRELLGVVKALQRRDTVGYYKRVWQAGLALRACRANDRAEGISEFLEVLELHAPEAPELLRAVVRGTRQTERFITQSANARDIYRGLDAAVDALRIDRLPAEGDAQASMRADPLPSQDAVLIDSSFGRQIVDPISPTIYQRRRSN